jgi:hypothetical protein
VFHVKNPSRRMVIRWGFILCANVCIGPYIDILK